MHVFIDTNVLLAFYEYSSDDLEELRKLVGLAEGERVTLYLTEQVIFEFRRNREKQIASSIKKLREQRLALQFPVICREYEEYGELRELQRRYQQVHQHLLEKLLADGENHALKADEVIEGLMQVAKRTLTTEAVREAAARRIGVGNPPGKAGSLGDAINWESLLSEVPDGCDLCFVTDDGDYLSQLSRHRFDEFLATEWKEKKEGEIKLYQDLSSFFAEHFPAIRLADEIEKDLLIAELSQSGSFATTHSVVARLRKYAEFTAAQRNAIASAVTTNNQVHWILGDWDVRDLVEKVLEGHEADIDRDVLEALKELLEVSAKDEEEVDDPDDEGLPF